MEDVHADTSRAHLEQFLRSLTDFKTPVDSISELAKHEKVDGRASWTEAEMESELLYTVQLYLTHLGCPLEYLIPASRAVVNEVLDGSFRLEDFQTPPPQLTNIENNHKTANENENENENNHKTAEENGGHKTAEGNGELPDVVGGSVSNGEEGQMEKTHVLSGKHLHSYAIMKANELLSRWKEETPQLEALLLPHGISLCAVKNKRPGMEDRHVIIPDLRAVVDVKGIKSPVSFYAVYDGHAGSIAASYAAAHLHRLMCSSRNYPHHMEEALREAFLSTDDLYTVKGLRDKDYSGTTAVVSVVYEKKLYIAWVGDSEAAIVQNGRADRLVEPRHTADNETERNRVQNEGGTVIVNQGGWRVAAVLTVTRAIGDSGFKPFVTARPDIRVVDLDGSEDYLIIACDGLWDEMSPKMAMEETNAFLLKNPHRVTDVAKELADRARRSGSMDNITVIVVLLKPINQILEELRERSETAVDAPVGDGRTEFLNSMSRDSDDFADLADSNEFPVEFDPSQLEQSQSRNPFDVTPLDSSVLGDFGTPSSDDVIERDGDAALSTGTEWDFKSGLLNFNEEESSALNVLDDVIAGAGVPESPSHSQELIHFDDSNPAKSGQEEGKGVGDLLGEMGESGVKGQGGEGAHSVALSGVNQDEGSTSVLHESPGQGSVADTASGMENLSLRQSSEPNSGSAPLPPAVPMTPTKADLPVPVEASSNSSPNPVSGKPASAAKNSKSAEEKGKSKAAGTKPGAPSSSSPKTASAPSGSSPKSAGPSSSSPKTASAAPSTSSNQKPASAAGRAKPATLQTPEAKKPAPSTRTTTAGANSVSSPEAKKTPVASARKPAVPATPKTDAVKPASLDKVEKKPAVLTAGVPKTTRPPSSGPTNKASTSGNAAGSSSAVAPSGGTPPAKSGVPKAKDLAPRTPERPADGGAAKALPATPRNTPVVAHRRLPPPATLPAKSASAGTAADKVAQSGEAVAAPSSRSETKTNGAASARTAPDAAKKAGSGAAGAARTATTPAVKTPRPAGTDRLASATRPTLASSAHNGGGADTPKSKSGAAVSEMKTPAVPAVRTKPDVAAAKRTPATQQVAPSARPAVGTPRPAASAEGASSKTFTRPSVTQVNGGSSSTAKRSAAAGGVAATSGSGSGSVAAGKKGVVGSTSKSKAPAGTAEKKAVSVNGAGAAGKMATLSTGLVANGEADHAGNGDQLAGGATSSGMEEVVNGNGEVPAVGEAGLLENGSGDRQGQQQQASFGLEERNGNDENALAV